MLPGQVRSTLDRNHPLVREAMMAKMMSDLLKLHKQFLNGMEELSAYAKTIKNLPKGDKGDMPKVNYDHIIKTITASIPKPKDGESPNEDAIVEKVSKRIRQPKDGETPVINEAKIADRVLKLIPKSNTTEVDHEKLADMVVKRISDGKKLKIEHVAGLRSEVDSYRSQLAGKVYGKDTWARGGGDTVVAGTGITFTIDANGNKIINSSGSGNTAKSTDLSSQCNGSNLVFTIPAFTTIISLIGSDAPIIYRPGIDYNAAGTTLTLAGVNPPSNGATLILTYV